MKKKTVEEVILTLYKDKTYDEVHDFLTNHYTKSELIDCLFNVVSHHMHDEPIWGGSPE